MTIEEAYRDYPPGTVFCPAQHTKSHLAGNMSAIEFITVKKGDTFTDDYNTGAIKLIPVDNRCLPWTPMIYTLDKIKAIVISKPESKIPDKWILAVTAESIGLINKYRATKKKNPSAYYSSIKIDNWNYIKFTGEGINSKDTYPLITFEQFKLIFNPDIITGKIESGSGTTKDPYQISDVDQLPNDLGSIEFLRNYPEILNKLKESSSDKSLLPFINSCYVSKARGGFNWDESVEGQDFWNTIIDNENPEYYYTKYPKNIVTSVIPTKWFLKITYENIHLVNTFRKSHGGFGEIYFGHEYEYIDEQSLGYRPGEVRHSPREIISTEQFINFCKEKGIIVNTFSIPKIKEKLEYILGSDLISKKQQKQIIQVDLIPVKQRRII